MSTESLQSPKGPDFSQSPLFFDTEWLRPPLNDVHARSRLQALVFGFLRSSRQYLQESSMDELKDNTHYASFMDTLKRLTALDVCQPPPLRTALAKLWSAYLSTVDPAITITAATWLTDQIKGINPTCNMYPPQAGVLVESCGLVFADHSKIILPLAASFVNSLLRINHHIADNPSLGASCGTALLSLVNVNTSFLGVLMKECATKIAVPMIEAKGAALRIIGYNLICRFINGGLQVSSLNKSAVKGYCEISLNSGCAAERQAASELLALLLLVDGQVKNSQIMDSWIKIHERLAKQGHSNRSIPVLLHLFRLKAACVTDFFAILLQEVNLSSTLLPASQRKVWTIPPGTLIAIFHGLSELISPNDLLPLIKMAGDNSREHIKNTIASFTAFFLELHGHELSLNELIDVILNLGSLSQGLYVCRALAISLSTHQDRISQYLSDALSRFRNVDGLSKTSLAMSIGFMLAVYQADSLHFNMRHTALSAELADATRSIDETVYWVLIAGVMACQGSQSEIMDSLFQRFTASEGTNNLDFSGNVLVNILNMKPLCDSDLGVVSSFLNSQFRKISDFTSSLVNEQFDRVELCFVNAAQVLIKSQKSLPTLADSSANALLKVIAEYNHTLPESFLSGPVKDILNCFVVVANAAQQRTLIMQIAAFFQQESLKMNCFMMVHHGILPVLKLKHPPRPEVEQTFIVECLKEIIFPFVCFSDETVQRLAVSDLGAMCTLVGNRTFRDLMLKELIDRSLNEQTESYRRGYILGMGHVFASLPEQGGHLDAKLMIGLLSSLSKDGRSLIVQSAALETLQLVLDVRTQSVPDVLISDMIYLVWQVYMMDPNLNSDSYATGEVLLGPLAKNLLVLIELLGPEIQSNRTISRICCLMTANFSELQTEDKAVLSSTIDALTQVLLLTHTVYSTPSAIRFISKCLDDPLLASQSMSCLKWLLDFQGSVVMNHVSYELLISLLKQTSIDSSDACVVTDEMFVYLIQNDFAMLVNVLQSCQLGSYGASSDVISNGSVAGSFIKDDELLRTNNSSLVLSRLPHQALFDPIAISNVLKSFQRHFPLIQKHLDQEISHDQFNQVINDFIRVAMSLMMDQRCEAAPKLVGLSLAQDLATKLEFIADWLDPSACLLDTYQSQLVSIFSTGANSDDLIVVLEALTMSISFKANRSRFSSASKISTMVKKAHDLLVNPSQTMETSESFKEFFDRRLLNSLCSLYFLEAPDSALRSKIANAISLAINRFSDGANINRDNLANIACVAMIHEIRADFATFCLLLSLPPSEKTLTTIAYVIKHNINVTLNASESDVASLMGDYVLTTFKMSPLAVKASVFEARSSLSQWISPQEWTEYAQWILGDLLLNSDLTNVPLQEITRLLAAINGGDLLSVSFPFAFELVSRLFMVTDSKAELLASIYCGESANVIPSILFSNSGDPVESLCLAIKTFDLLTHTDASVLYDAILTQMRRLLRGATTRDELIIKIWTDCIIGEHRSETRDLAMQSMDILLEMGLLPPIDPEIIRSISSRRIFDLISTYITGTA